jgi:hypothetical protein
MSILQDTIYRLKYCHQTTKLIAKRKAYLESTVVYTKDAHFSTVSQQSTTAKGRNNPLSTENFKTYANENQSDYYYRKSCSP